ncbi:class I SAM-dependent methyltransferase [Oxynema aestuarii]|jgi:SAM-dependent methyltransferase|uniref:Class I SAM-dependent methyltransferase n=1 Tax=Oxynema aestuarii AP17 TaxID=2064643 RepID=A0A6H1U1E8_9CYAN|nr:class I SAM-dependent methyltransferase [Oxynema aestuarii]QIZ72207.1 class I SAM-dependent methyltransferase [Oxynema aestuarii AP17]
MKPTNWNEYLSENNPWTKRLIGLEDFSRTRNIGQIEAEYNRVKYGQLADYNGDCIEAYKQEEFKRGGFDDGDDFFISFEENLFKTKLFMARSIFYSLITHTVKKYSSDTLCELGCGYGYNLSYLKNTVSLVYGGEYSKNAVELGKKLNLNVIPFNYYDSNDYQIIKPSSTILTVHSVEQIPNAECFIEGLSSVKNNIVTVINIEPSFLPSRHTLVGCLRNRYIELNDYNRNLFSLLKNRNDIEIIHYSEDIFGINPLNSASLAVWQFK